MTAIASRTQDPERPSSGMVLLLADLQDGFADLPLTIPRAVLERNVDALMRLADIFDIPLVVTAVPGLDGTVPPLLAPLETGRGLTPIDIRTTSNCLDDQHVRAAIERTGRKKLVLAGIATEIAVQLASLTAVSDGYDVHILVDVCGGLGEVSERAAHARMSQAGAKLSSLPALIGELASDTSPSQKQRANQVLLQLVTG